ncbi:tRNA (adenosine(37)-N6)-threonylcarbamoyltransferase complex ATPase subunit type 1 TsaE [Jatrophihabitans sp. YIM 134969]
MAGGVRGGPGGPRLPVDTASALTTRLGGRQPALLATAADTQEFGRQLGETLRPGDVVVLRGPLGAGKTVLAKGIGAGLGITEPVTSPTFVIARVHPHGRVPMVHVDAYRLGGVAEVDDLDLDVDVEDSVTVVEWGEGVAEQLTPDWLLVDVERRDDDVRVVTLHPHGETWADRL